MPLPANGTVWPPRDLDPVTARLSVWSAWYSGDSDHLSDLYGGTLAGDPGNPASGPLAPDRPGLRGRVGRTLARWFWGTPTAETERRTKLHVPLAGDIAATSADLLFSEPPTFTAESDATQARLDELVGDGLHADLLEAAEVCAALGGVYLRTCWDTSVRDRPWLGVVHADAAIPEWRWGQLTAVTFWQVVHRDGSEVWRHLERHEPGLILNGLYKGGLTDLGKIQDLSAHPATKGLQSMVETRVPDGLTAGYIPNMRPARVWRDTPAGAHLGRADFSGTESLMDSLDETYSSLMRDIRLGKARLLVPETYLQSQGRGKGATWDSERELYTPMDALVGTTQAGGLAITPAQFAIRVTEHLETARALTDQIVRMSGYSTQTFGTADQVAVTATEVTARERRSLITRDRKTGYWSPGLAERLRVLLAIDAAHFRSGVTPERPTIKFGDSVSEDPASLAQTAQLMRAAEAASTETLVQMMHPDWDDPQIQAEVKRIKDEGAMSVPGSGVGMGPGDTGPGAPFPPDGEDEPAEE
ncbi:phage portal protein [Actinomadura hibisca]|uniref:phage portal protein n=1 Tax=Actinomadura hibisca TaxID=68565 RepID=UPI00082E443F|nr:phage portal protein [Actinomadura hibisca]